MHSATYQSNSKNLHTIKILMYRIILKDYQQRLSLGGEFLNWFPFILCVLSFTMNIYFFCNVKKKKKKQCKAYYFQSAPGPGYHATCSSPSVCWKLGGVWARDLISNLDLSQTESNRNSLSIKLTYRKSYDNDPSGTCKYVRMFPHQLVLLGF